jgi:hypothetical protein
MANPIKLQFPNHHNIFFIIRFRYFAPNFKFIFSRNSQLKKDYGFFIPHSLYQKLSLLN